MDTVIGLETSYLKSSLCSSRIYSLEHFSVIDWIMGVFSYFHSSFSPIFNLWDSNALGQPLTLPKHDRNFCIYVKTYD